MYTWKYLTILICQLYLNEGEIKKKIIGKLEQNLYLKTTGWKFVHRRQFNVIANMPYIYNEK